MLSFLLSLLLSAQASATAGAGTVATPALSERPFGVHKGMTTAELEKALGGPLVPADAGLGVFEGAPLRHPEFRLYLYMHSPKTGVCGVGAISAAVGADDASKAGALLLQKFDALKTELQAAFGEPKTIERPKQLEIADLQSGKANLKADWVLDSKHPGDVASVSVWALPKPPVAMLRIIFRFANASAAFRSGKSNACE